MNEAAERRNREAEAVLRLIAARFDPLTRDVAPLLRAALATERVAVVARLRGLRDQISVYADESARLEDPRGSGFAPDYWLGLSEAIGQLDDFLDAEAER